MCLPIFRPIIAPLPLSPKHTYDTYNEIHMATKYLWSRISNDTRRNLLSLRASSLGGGGREGERGESLQRCLRNLNAAPHPQESLLAGYNLLDSGNTFWSWVDSKKAVHSRFNLSVRKRLHGTWAPS